jgi:hypothetical protein
MPMRMVHVGYVRMRVPHRGVLVKMRVRLTWRVGSSMPVLVMLVVHMRMRMAHHLVNMFMLVVLGRVQPYAYTHQTAGDCELCGDGIAEHDDRCGAA